MMKKRTLWLILSCMMIVVLVLSSCAPKAEPTIPTPTTPTPTPTPTPTRPGPEVPKYGGRFVDALPTPHDTFDDYETSSANAFTCHMTTDKLFIGDWARGAAGTNEWDFWLSTYNPKFEIGCLAESWEVPDRITHNKQLFNVNYHSYSFGTAQIISRFWFSEEFLN